MNRSRNNPKPILQNRFLELQIRLQKIKNIVHGLDDLEMELLLNDSTSQKRIIEIKNKLWAFYLSIESFIGEESTLAFHMWQDQFEEDPLEAVSYPTYTLDRFDLSRVEKQILVKKVALAKLN